MKLYATLKNERGGKKQTGDDTRILVELSYKNKILGTVGLYAIIDDQKEGYRIVWNEEGKGFDPDLKPILEVEYKKAKVEKGTPREGICHCGYPCIYGTDHCDRHQTP